VFGSLVATLLVLANPVADGAWASARLEQAIDAYKSGDYRNARRHFRRLADHGSAVAETMLGFMYRDGKGVAVKPGVAAAYFYRSARRGYGPAMVALSDCYARGAGVGRNERQAYFWAVLATRGGDRSAESEGHARAGQLRGRLTARELADVEKEVSMWQPRPRRQR
jgi:hypothetical protein